MRVISTDGTNNVSYEGNIFCIISDEEHEEFIISVRTDYIHYLPLASYKTKDLAVKAMNDMAIAAQTSLQNYPYHLQ